MPAGSAPASVPSSPRTATPARNFPARSTLVIPRMGKRAPQTDQANEYKDMYFREVLIDLESTADLPVNLRVQVRVDTSERKDKR